MGEISDWIDIKEYELLYQINKLGQVQNKISKRLLKYDTVKGYKRVRLNKRGKQKSYLVHRLVLSTFIGDCPSGYQANHIDGNLNNNCLDNLEYITASDNCIHRYKVLNRAYSTTKRRLDKETVVNIRQETNLNITRIANKYNINRSTVRSILKFKTWKQINARTS